MKIILSIFIIAFCCCKTTKTQKESSDSQTEFTPQFVPGPQALIYKTKGDYNNLVPITLSDDKTQIVSYPDPTDIVLDNKYPTPTTLNNGYLLDNRGIGTNVAFLKLTYEEYSKLKNVPSLTELNTLIIDKDPLIELCDCGNKKAFSNPANQLNLLIDSNRLRTICKVIR